MIISGIGGMIAGVGGIIFCVVLEFRFKEQVYVLSMTIFGVGAVLFALGFGEIICNS